jgi:hypothetical protein
MNKQITHTISDALDYIQQQQENGSFISSNDKRVTFYAALIVCCLKKIHTEQSTNIKNSAIEFLLQQKSEQWSYNYWHRNSNESITTSYPDDLDDTFNALLAIGPEYIDEHTWSHIIPLLTANEITEGGPYQTWILSSTERTNTWHDIDPVVNSAILRFVKEYSITLPKVQNYIDDCIFQNKVHSKYYHEEIGVLYFISHSYNGEHAHLLVQKINNIKNDFGYWSSPLHTAYAISSLLRLGENPQSVLPAVEYLLQSHCKGQWQLSPIYIEKIANNKTEYSSCSAYISACCIEALQIYLDRIKQETVITLHIEKELAFITEVINRCKKRFEDTSKVLQYHITSLLDGLKTKDPQSEIILLPFYFAKQLNVEIKPEVVLQLAVANTLGWIGYSIKDSLLDSEGSVELLPCATICVREANRILNSLHTRLIPQDYIEKVLDSIEISTLWEYSHCKLNDKHIVPAVFPVYGTYQVLADKSYGHALGPVILSSYTNNENELSFIKDFFNHYLIARQLNDDAHDWLQDLEQGYLNSVSTEMIKITLTTEKTSLQSFFWNYHIDSTCEIILHHTNQARLNIQKITILEHSDFLENLLKPLEQSCYQALRERNKTQRLLKEYQITQSR